MVDNGDGLFLSNQFLDLNAEAVATREWSAWPMLGSQLPIQFGNGNILARMRSRCARCDLDIPDENQHGIVHRPLATLVDIRSWGLCPNCGTYCRADGRIRDDASIEGKFMGESGPWLRATQQKKSLAALAWSKIKQFAGSGYKPPESGFLRALSRDMTKENAEIIRALEEGGWAGAMEGELAQKGYRNLKIRGTPETWLIVMSGIQLGKEATIVVGLSFSIPDGQCLGPLAWMDVTVQA